jgi:hypothetical protein
VTNVTMARPRAPHRSFNLFLPVLAVLLTGLALAAATLIVDEPARVRHVAIVNRGDTPITVAVSSSADDGVQLLGTVDPASTHTVHDLVDQGSSWVFSFSSAGVDVGSIRVSRAALARQDWHLVVPAAVFDQLSRTGR